MFGIGSELVGGERRGKINWRNETKTRHQSKRRLTPICRIWRIKVEVDIEKANTATLLILKGETVGGRRMRGDDGKLKVNKEKAPLAS